MARIYANSIERGSRSLNTVPGKLHDEVKALVIADGYEFDADGYAHKVEKVIEPIEEPSPEVTE